ncbi:hypothetical protein [Prevotella sp.]|jgi:hypothetical protein|uniref:hypothetical protein n=1 Tax=Prevotella sp. TaxID=59823 RepID=UPI002E790848|nr:hypothetical protein [Prevotella sp.]MEE0671143.1 hypothetical protein [Prevotella sp.]
MIKYFISLLLSFVGEYVFAQTNIPDTLLVRTDKNDLSVTRYYVVGRTKEMIVYSSAEKQDTTIYDDLCEETKEAYVKELNIMKFRQLPISKIGADKVFSYFRIGESIESVTKRLGNKKVHITPRGYEVPFYNSFRKKNEIFEFTFIDGKLSSMGRASTNTLPTNDVWLAFNIMPLKEQMKDLELLLNKLRKMK